MLIKDFYAAVEGNYEEILCALGKEERVVKFLLKFPQSNIDKELTAAMESKDFEAAFRAAHTLKGMSINIGLKSLHSISSQLTESLRYGPTGDVEGLTAKTLEEYNRICTLISELEQV